MPKFTVTSYTDDSGIWAESADGEGIHAVSNSAVFAAIAAIQVNESPGAHGAAVYAECRGEGAAIAGFQKHTTSSGNAIYGESEGQGDAIAGIQRNPNSSKAGIYGEHISGGTAGFFRGNVIVTGDISFPGADCAEHFTIGEDAAADPGTVMALTDGGVLVPAAVAYERKVVGVVAGAGSFRTGIVLDKQDYEDPRRRPIALVGKVFCKADARYGPIEVGDLLTSSDTAGHAMCARDPSKAFGAVIGKAMAPLNKGVGLVPAVIALQ
ncbi:hypothetical protein [Rhodococcus sp. M8-35]|uniref:hypothetical protein n=1 Tax=Rhodococcus sp. M8-35 TaxID=3058401 RepID=UPI002ED21217